MTYEKRRRDKQKKEKERKKRKWRKGDVGAVVARGTLMRREAKIVARDP